MGLLPPASQDRLVLEGVDGDAGASKENFAPGVTDGVKSKEYVLEVAHDMSRLREMRP